MAIQDIEVGALVKAGIFPSRQEAIREALRMLFVARPQLKVEAALQLYKTGDVTLGRAAEIAGLTRWEFESLLADRGIERVVACDPSESLDHQTTQLHQSK
jgi:predicted HTH domain antitoxin